MAVVEIVGDAMTRELDTIPPNGIMVDLCAACGIDDEAKTAEQGVKMVASGMGGAMEWKDVYNAAEMFHIGCTVKDIKEAVVRGEQKKLFTWEFNACKSFAEETGVRISNMTLPAFKVVADKGDVVLYIRGIPVPTHAVPTHTASSAVKRRKVA